MSQNVFLDIGVIIIAATLVVLLAKRFKQPLIPAYIFAGLLIGPFFAYVSSIPFFSSLLSSVFHLQQGVSIISNHDLIATLSEVGIALLLFIVGLEVNLSSFKEVGKVTTVGGMLNILLLLGTGFIISILFGFKGIEAVYLAFIFVFSSTMVLVKLMSDRKEVDSLHGKILVGFLLLEDLVAIIALLVLTSFNNFSWLHFIFTILFAVGIITILILMSSYLLPYIFKFIASSKEILFLSALGVCFLFSIVFSSLGFSMIIGAFVAGIILGNLPYNFEIIGRVKSLRDFFATLFFVSLGMQLDIAGVMNLFPFFMAALLVITVLKPILSMLIVGAFGYRRYTSFKVGTSLTQVSEFSLVLVSQGMLLGVVSKNAFSVVVMLAIVTITLTTYIFTHQLEIYKRIKHQLGFLEFPDHMHKTNHHYKVPASEIVLCGCDRMGRSILGKLTNDKKVPLVVDYNPKIISALNERHIPAMYGDITNEEILEHIDIKKVKILINTIKNQEASMLLLNEIRKRNKKLVFIDSAGKVNDALELYKNGADYVILPHFLSGDYISLLLSQKNLSRISVSRKNHIKELMKHQAHFLEDNHINEEHHVHD